MEPGTSAAARAPGLFERRRRRARLREQLALREEMLLELGALVFELHRQGQRAPELLQARAAELDVVDSEVRAMEESLAGGDPSSWPAGPPPAPAWDDQTGEWDAVAEPTGEWDAAEADWGETGEWETTDQTGEWDQPADEDLGETQEWSVTEALEAQDVSEDPHDPAAEDAVETTTPEPDEAAAEDPADGGAAHPDDPVAEDASNGGAAHPDDPVAEDAPNGGAAHPDDPPAEERS